ncbi:GumC family protein [Porphyromonas macacae]|uniref:GumC family protein n=1 Tax=Porphyromonas macacae TaxID=28115 RepID=UPI00359FAFD5
MDEIKNAYNEGIDSNESFDLKMLIDKYIIHWKWFLFSIFLCLLGAYLYLRYTPKQYEVSASILFKEEKNRGGSNPAADFINLQNFGFSTTSNVANELEILRSKSLIKKTVVSIDAHIDYLVKGKVASSYLFFNQPVRISTSGIDLEKIKNAFRFTAKINKEGSVLIKWIDEEKKEISQTFSQFPTTFASPVGVLSLYKEEGRNWDDHVGETIYITVNPPINKAKDLLRRISVSLTDKRSSVVSLRFRTLDREWGEFFIRKLIDTYNEESNLDKNTVAQKTEEFINDRLSIIGRELGNTEKQLESTKRSAGLTTIKDLEVIVKGKSEIDQQLVKVNTQLKIMEYLQDYVQDLNNKDQVIPSNVGLEDLSLTSLIDQYNIAIIERNQLARTVSDNSPLMLQKNESLKHLRSNVLASINSAYKGLRITEKGIKQQANKFNSQISSAPTQERILVDINRQQEIQAQLFLMLMQKREENSIAMAATADNAKIIDDALASSVPVSPRKNLILLSALILGFVIPVLIFFLLDFFRTKIESHREIERLSKMPIWGDVPFEKNSLKDSIQVKKDDNGVMAEVFRTLRTNIQFSLQEEDQVILFTSTKSGEGKSFISSNLAVSLALLGKKVIIIGMDIRNPQLHSIFQFQVPPKGLTNLIAEKSLDYEAYLSYSKQTENLHILNAGAIPPNPAELLDRPILKDILEKMRRNYDYIIIDSAPAGLVVDTLIVAKYADATVYVCRENYTERGVFGLINSLYLEKKFKNPGLVINGVDLKKMNRSYYGYGRQYGYGYGQEEKKTEGFLHSLFSKLKRNKN